MAKATTKSAKAKPRKAPAKGRRAAQVVRLEYTTKYEDAAKYDDVVASQMAYYPEAERGILVQYTTNFPALTGKEKKTQSVRLMPVGSLPHPVELRDESGWYLTCEGGPYVTRDDAVADARARIDAAILKDAFALPPKPGHTNVKKDAFRDVHEMRQSATGLFVTGPAEALKNNPLAIKALRHLFGIAAAQNSWNLSFSLSDLGRSMWGRKAYPKELQSLRAALDCMCVFITRTWKGPDGGKGELKYALLHRLEYYTKGKQTAVNVELTPELFTLNRAEIYLPRALDGLSTTADRLGNWVALKLAETTPGAAVVVSFADAVVITGLGNNRMAKRRILDAAKELQSAGLFVLQNVGPEGLTFRAASEIEALLLRAAAEN